MSSRRSFIKTVISVGTISVASSASANSVAQAPGQIASLDHGAVPMRSTEAMLSFYESLGFVVNQGQSICSVHFGDQKINYHRPILWQQKTFSLKAPAATPPCGDFCFVWNGTLQSLEATLNRVGATVIEGPEDRPGGRDGGTVGGRSLYTRDPDQNLLEFIVYNT